MKIFTGSKDEAMRFPDVRYEATKWPNYLLLHCFDGTARGVMFWKEGNAALACLPGRAEIDSVAIEDGLLPKGAYLVSRGGIPDDLKALSKDTSITEDDRDPLASIRLRFSISVAARRSEYVDEERNASMRAKDPERAARYDRAVSIIEGGNKDIDDGG